MARRKRKYTRHKAPRQDTVSLSSLIVGLLPVVLMAGLVGAYIVYQYTDILRLTAIPHLPALPSMNPEISFPSMSHPTLHLPELHLPEMHIPELTLPEVTVSFDEVFASFGIFGMAVLDGLMTSSERIVELVGVAGAWGIGLLYAGGVGVVSGIMWVVVSTEQVLRQFYAASMLYFQAVTWTLGDFVAYLDLPGKGQAVLTAVLWPLHFLDPRPAMQVASEKMNEMNHAVGQFFAPFGPIIAYIWKSFQETTAEVWRGLVDLWNFLNWLAEQSK